MYTGKNKSVIGFDIDFNALYFTAVQIDRGNTEKNSGTTAVGESSDKDKSSQPINKPGIQPAQQKVTSNSTQTTVGGANRREETQNARSVLESIYSAPGGDMITLKLQILGDPHFIKQDDLYLSPRVITGDNVPSDDSSTSQILKSVNSIVMDSGEIYCKVVFKTPKDFSEETG